jgi:hypothetical protein
MGRDSPEVSKAELEEKEKLRMRNVKSYNEIEVEARLEDADMVAQDFNVYSVVSFPDGLMGSSREIYRA